MENNDFSLNYICPLNPSNKNLSPLKIEKEYQSNSFINRDNLQNNQNILMFNSSLSHLSTPKKEYQPLKPEIILSPFFSSSKQELSNNNLLSFKKMNDFSPIKSLINTPCINSKILDKK